MDTDPLETILRQLTETLSFQVSVVEEEGGFVAFVDELPGCMTQADTEEELAANLDEAITGYLRAVVRGALVKVRPSQLGGAARPGVARRGARRAVVVKGRFAFV